MDLNTFLLQEFDADFDILAKLPIKSQITIFKKINPDIDCLFKQMESLSQATLLSIVSSLAQTAKDNRNQALRQGALDKTDINWMSSALLEHTYNSILSGDITTAQHISKKLMGWMNAIENNSSDSHFAGLCPLENDSLWLKGYRDSDWVSIASFSLKGSSRQSIDASSNSCYVDNSGLTFCIIRSNDIKNSVVTFFGCFFSSSMDDEIGIIVDRTEKLSGQIVKCDAWHKGKLSFLEKNTPGISNGIKMIRNMAAFNAHLTLPPYVFVMNATGEKNSPINK